MGDKTAICVKCVHANWQLTKNGRINRHRYGRCDAEPVIVLPASMMLHSPPHRTAIWAKNSIITECPMFREQARP